VRVGRHLAVKSCGAHLLSEHHAMAYTTCVSQIVWYIGLVEALQLHTDCKNLQTLAPASSLLALTECGMAW
jgi:hypothetical protein